MSEAKDAQVTTETHAASSTYVILRNRVVSGFFLALPIVLTLVIVNWIYNRIIIWILGPIYSWIVGFYRSNSDAETVEDPVTGDLVQELPFWIEYILAPIASVAVMLGVLFLLGMFFRSRIHRAVDWIMLNIPGVNWIYSVILKVVNTIQSSDKGKPRFQRVVLVDFPHPGTKVPAFVTSSCQDVSTGKTILCIYVPTTPVPTSGYMLMVPEEDVTELSWDLQETLEAIVSGGVTAPPKVEYFRNQGK